MNRLYIAGGSFATLSKNQPIGSSWSEILAEQYDLKLVNVSRVAASNFSIAIQLDWISNRIKENDLVIVLLTDHTRLTLVDLDVEKENKTHLIEYHSVYETQRISEEVNLSTNPRLMCATIHHSGKTKSFYRDWFDIEVQEFQDRLVLTGALANLAQKTKKFLVCKGGYENSSSKILCIDDMNYVPLTEQIMQGWSEPLTSETSNHMDSIAHKKVSIYLKKHVEKIYKDR